MIIYRPHRGGLKEAMKETVEFRTCEEMKAYIVEQHTDPEFGPAFDVKDIVLGEETMDDYRNGWHDTRYVCIRRYYNNGYFPPAPIGFFATDYEEKALPE